MLSAESFHFTPDDGDRVGLRMVGFYNPSDPAFYPEDTLLRNRHVSCSVLVPTAEGRWNSLVGTLAELHFGKPGV